jgi:hypothetical protein
MTLINRMTPGAAVTNPRVADPGASDYLLPDGEQFQPGSVTLSGGTLSFDSEVANTGQAPLELALNLNDDGVTKDVNQVLFHADGTTSLTPLKRAGFENDTRPDHDHLHFDDFVYFQLYRADSGHAPSKTPDAIAGGVGIAAAAASLALKGKLRMFGVAGGLGLAALAGIDALRKHDVPGSDNPVGPELTKGVKQSFFITDVTKVDGVPAENRAKANTLPGKGEVEHQGIDADVIQGISVGSADVYGAGLDGQSLNVGNLAPGRYVLRQTFDPNDEVKELDERNDSRDTVIEVSRDHKVRVVSSKLVDAAKYTKLADGREVIPEVVASMQKYYANRPAETTTATTGGTQGPWAGGKYAGPQPPIYGPPAPGTR